MKTREKFLKTVPHVDLKKFMAKWYVIAGRTTLLERNAFNSIERYVWNENKIQIDIEFSCRKGSFTGKMKRVPQRGWVENTKTNAHWKVQPFWPLKFDYLIIALAEDYSWTAIGIPSQRYLWIMAKEPHLSESKLSEIIRDLARIGYDTHGVQKIPQQKHFNDRNRRDELVTPNNDSGIDTLTPTEIPETKVRATIGTPI